MQPWEEARSSVPYLKTLAVNGLLQMFDPEKQLFCRRLKHTDRGLVREGTSHRYTLIALLGLHQLEASGKASPIAIKPVLKGLLTNTDWIDNVGDLGLLLWLCALEAPQQLEKVESCREVENALAYFRDGRQSRTMELAWFLAGLSHRSLACPEKQLDLRDTAFETYRRLRNNQGELGIFRHVGRTESFVEKIRSRIGSLADQVYPIYAITKFAQAYHVVKATERALDCALTLCQTQGPLGQWWWHYDSLSGRLVERYPVYSASQDGLAPLALFTLGEATHSDFSPWIYKGLQWVCGNNEMDFDMRDVSAKVVWRSILRRSSRRYWDLAVDFLTQREERATWDVLEVLFECRPDHFGWLLYAFPDGNNLSPPKPYGSCREAANL